MIKKILIGLIAVGLSIGPAYAGKYGGSSGFKSSSFSRSSFSSPSRSSFSSPSRSSYSSSWSKSSSSFSKPAPTKFKTQTFSRPVQTAPVYSAPSKPNKVTKPVANNYKPIPRTRTNYDNRYYDARPYNNYNNNDSGSFFLPFVGGMLVNEMLSNDKQPIYINGTPATSQSYVNVPQDQLEAIDAQNQVVSTKEAPTVKRSYNKDEYSNNASDPVGTFMVVAGILAALGAVGFGTYWFVFRKKVR